MLAVEQEVPRKEIIAAKDEIHETLEPIYEVSEKLNIELPQSLRVIKVSIERKMSTLPRNVPLIENDRYFEDKMRKVIKASLYDRGEKRVLPEVQQKFGIELKTERRMSRIDGEILYVAGLLITPSTMMREEAENMRKRMK